MDNVFVVVYYVPNMDQRIRLAIALALLVGLAGCAQISIDSTVTADGEIEEYNMVINTSTTVYGFLNEDAKEEGYDDIGEMWQDDLDEEDVSSFNYSEEIDGDEVTMRFQLEGWTPDSDSNISIEKSDGTMVYEDVTWVNESAEEGENSEMLSGMVVQYRLTMPGEITDSNADEVDGNTATWTETGHDAMTDNRIYAESEISSSSGVGPGFTTLTALFAALTGIGYLLVRRRSTG